MTAEDKWMYHAGSYWWTNIDFLRDSAFNFNTHLKSDGIHIITRRSYFTNANLQLTPVSACDQNKCHKSTPLNTRHHTTCI